MNNVLVTGGCGFIGSHIVDKLIGMGKNVFVVDNETSSSAAQYYYNDHATYFKDSITNSKKLAHVFEKSIDTVFHLAALSRIPYSIEHPTQACETNCMGTLNVLEMSRHYGVKRVIYSSTSSAYGLKNSAPQNEDMQPDCLNPYSASKVAGENLCKIYTSLYDVETVILRYFNVYGERHPTQGSYAPVVGVFKQQALEGKPMTIFGDGKQRRDFTHVKDVVKANILAAESVDKNVLGEIFNVGGGVNYSILEIANLIGGEYMLLAPKPGEAQETLANIDKIKKLLGWKPEIKLENWIKKQNNKIKESGDA